VHDGYPVGRVTSARFSPALRKSIGLAWVPASDGAEGTRIRIQLNGRAVPARVVSLPFYDPAGTRMKC
jgi:glycine cleavage system aminomethyltransferase T